jgi:tryptophanyl-tRNA synthetase
MLKDRKILVSGIQPSGRLHIGNYFGALKQFVEYQNEYNTQIMIADLHTLTTLQDAKKLKTYVEEIALDMLAAGLDPKKVTLFRQSDVPQHAELTWIFNCLVTVPWLERAHAFKDKTAKGKEANVGLFDYPVLQAADILLYDPDLVPVGKDQKQHVEMAREIARKFNSTFGEIFVEPKELIKEDLAVIPGIDGEKMSKSYNNTIPLFGTNEEIEKVVMSIVTGSNPKGSTNNPHDTLFSLLWLFLEDDEKYSLRERYESGSMGYKEAKELLIKKLLEFIEPLRKRREEYAKDMDKVRDILKKGGEKAQRRAAEKMKKVREKVGLM